MVSNIGRAVVVFTLCYFVVACNQTAFNETTNFHGNTMGTSWSVKVVALPGQTISQTPNNKLSLGIQQTLDTIDQLMSTWRSDSELSRFNQTPKDHWIPLSNDTFSVLELALKIAEETAGSFDITVTPLVNLWGFGPSTLGADSRIDVVPDDRAIQRALSKVGYQQIHLDQNKQQIIKRADRVIDLSAIAKGYAVDKVAAYLDGQGFEHYLVEVGGEVRAQGKKSDGAQWTIAIESPLIDQRRVHHSLKLIDAAVATSGDYRNYFETNGKRYSHTIDPTTGRPINHTLASVTVVAKTAAQADAYATALMVMGLDNGIRFAEKNNIAAYFIFKQAGEFTTSETSQFSLLTGKKMH